MTPTTRIRGYFVIPRLRLDIFYRHTKFGDSRFNRSWNMTPGVKISNGSRDRDHAPFKGDLLSVCWDFIQANCNSVYTTWWLASAENWNGSRDLTTPFQGWFVILDLGFATVNLSTKLKSFKSLSPPTTKIWKGIQNVYNGVVWGREESLKVTENSTIR